MLAIGRGPRPLQGIQVLGAREPLPSVRFLRIASDSVDIAEAEATFSCKRAEYHFRVQSSEGKGAREAGCQWLVSSVHAFLAAAATSSAVPQR